MILNLFFTNVNTVATMYVMEYVPASIIERTATITSATDASEVEPMFAMDMIDPSIVIKENGTGMAEIMVTTHIQSLFFI